MKNENITKNGWSEYGRLVLNELKRLNDGQEKLGEDFDRKFVELNESISNFKKTEGDVEDIKEWKDKITEVWSPTQMKQVKDEVYKQKGYFQRGIGIVIAIQLLLSLFMIFKDKIF